MNHEDILNGLRTYSMHDKIEIIANVLINLGCEGIQEIPDRILKPEELIELIISNKKRQGETIYNALAHQGLIMLMWLKPR